MNFATPKIMGVINITPDSFSDGGECFFPEKAVEKIRRLIDDGADIIDIGGESTKPDSTDVSLSEELKRVGPVIDFIARQKFPANVIFSIDTHKAAVAEYALERGFQMVNDVTALRGDPEIQNVALRYGPYLVLMYAKDQTPRTTRNVKEYADVIATIKEFFTERIAILLSVGFPQEKIILDPGCGLFVSPDSKYSHEIINRLSEFQSLRYPILIGISRKIGGDETSVALSLNAIKNGASIVRVHDVSLMKEAIDKSRS